MKTAAIDISNEDGSAGPQRRCCPFGVRIYVVLDGMYVPTGKQSEGMTASLANGDAVPSMRRVRRVTHVITAYLVLSTAIMVAFMVQVFQKCVPEMKHCEDITNEALCDQDPKCGWVSSPSDFDTSSRCEPINPTRSICGLGITTLILDGIMVLFSAIGCCVLYCSSSPNPTCTFGRRLVIAFLWLTHVIMLISAALIVGNYWTSNVSLSYVVIVNSAVMVLLTTIRGVVEYRYSRTN